MTHLHNTSLSDSSSSVQVRWSNLRAPSSRVEMNPRNINSSEMLSQSALNVSYSNSELNTFYVAISILDDVHNSPASQPAKTRHTHWTGPVREGAKVFDGGGSRLHDPARVVLPSSYALNS